MYHEEKVINGVMCWRGTPAGAWTTLSREALTDRLVLSRGEAGSLRAAIGRLKRYFASGNDIPVERATIPAQSFWEIVGHG